MKGIHYSNEVVIHNLHGFLMDDCRFSHQQSIQDWAHAHWPTSAVTKIHSSSLSIPPAQPFLPCSSARNLGFVFDPSLSSPANKTQSSLVPVTTTYVTSVVSVTPSTTKQHPQSPPLLSIPISTAATHSVTFFPHLNSTVFISYKIH